MAAASFPERRHGATRIDIGEAAAGTEPHGSASASFAASPSVVSFAQELIRTPSLPGQEGRVAELLAETMTGCGFHEVRIDAAGNVVGRYRGSGSGDSSTPGETARTLLFDGHMDTVNVGDRSSWQHDPFGGEIEETALAGSALAGSQGVR